MMAKPLATAAASQARKAAQPSSPPPARRSASAHERAPRLQWSIGTQARPASSPPRARQPVAEPSRDAPAQEAEPTLTPGRPPGPAWDFGKLPLSPAEPASGPRASASLPINIQRKLAIGSVDDLLEHEADRVADQVMRMPNPAAAPPQVSRKCGACEEQVSRKCAACEEKEKGKKREAGPQAAVGQAPASVHEALRSPGQPLDAATRAYFEPRFGHDFGRVRIHTGPQADRSAQAVNSVAYTVGRNIAFAGGQYAPSTLVGARLLAHELTHVVQQQATDRLAYPSDSEIHHSIAASPAQLTRQKEAVPSWDFGKISIFPPSKQTPPALPRRGARATRSAARCPPARAGHRRSPGR